MNNPWGWFIKILIVNTYDACGGASRAATRLHHSLRSLGVDSQMLVQWKMGGDDSVFGPTTKLEKGLVKVRPVLDQAVAKLFYPHKKNQLFSSSVLASRDMVKKINSFEADIVHLHWICDGMLRVEDLPKIKAPLVWSLHDNWAFTGGCHTMWECSKYAENCGACPQLDSSFLFDLSRFNHKRKQRAYQQLSNLTIVGLSRWLRDRAKESSLFRDKKVVHLPNPIDTERFAPVEKIVARELLNLPFNKKLVLCGAMNLLRDENKGFHFVEEAQQHLQQDNLEFVIVGCNQPKNFDNKGIPHHFTGHIHDDLTLRLLYSACDVTIVPSKQENLSNTLMESMACGTPAVAFGVGGNADLIEHQQNGYLCKPFDSQDLAKGIRWVFQNSDSHDLCNQSRNKIEEEFSSLIVAEQYVQLYKDLLQGS